MLCTQYALNTLVIFSHAFASHTQPNANLQLQRKWGSEFGIKLSSNLFLSQHSSVIIFTVKSSFHPAEILPANCKTKIRDQQQTQIRASIAWNINYIFFLPFNVPLESSLPRPSNFRCFKFYIFPSVSTVIDWHWLQMIAILASRVFFSLLCGDRGMKKVHLSFFFSWFSFFQLH